MSARIVVGDRRAFEAPSSSRSWARVETAGLGEAFTPRQLGRHVVGDLGSGPPPPAPALRVSYPTSAGERSFAAPFELARPLVAAGMRLRVAGLERTHPELAGLAEQAGELVGAGGARAIAGVVTPEGHEAAWAEAPAHWFVLQAEGTARWSLESPGAGETAIELSPEAGLYIPPGWPRRWRATTRACHLVISLDPVIEDV